MDWLCIDVDCCFFLNTKVLREWQHRRKLLVSPRYLQYQHVLPAPPDGAESVHSGGGKSHKGRVRDRTHTCISGSYKEKVKGRGSCLIAEVDVCLLGDEQGDHVRPPLLRGEVERRDSLQ